MLSKRPDTKLTFLSAQPDDLHYFWQVEVQLHNFKRLGVLDKYNYIVLVWVNEQAYAPKYNQPRYNDKWKVLGERYAEDGVEIHMYKDTTGHLVRNMQKYGYPSIVRPWILDKHFSLHADCYQKTFFYLDADVIFTKSPDWLDDLIDDDIIYCSDTTSYIAASYFDSKKAGVLPGKEDGYSQIDPLEESMNIVGLTRKDAERNEAGSGGAQYILKKLPYHFWRDVFIQCINIKLNLTSYNRRFFKDEDAGFQSWCADMWAVLWLLWKAGRTTACPTSMDFAWATDLIGKVETRNIYHNAGVSPKSIKYGDRFHHLFYKGEAKYVSNKKMPYTENLDKWNSDFASKFYVDEIKMVRDKYYAPSEKVSIPFINYKNTSHG